MQLFVKRNLYLSIIECLSPIKTDDNLQEKFSTDEKIVFSFSIFI